MPGEALNHAFVTLAHLVDYAHCNNVKASVQMMEVRFPFFHTRDLFLKSLFLIIYFLFCRFVVATDLIVQLRQVITSLLHRHRLLSTLCLPPTETSLSRLTIKCRDLDFLPRTW